MTMQATESARHGTIIWDEESLRQVVNSQQTKVEKMRSRLRVEEAKLAERQAMLDRLRAGEQVVSTW